MKRIFTIFFVVLALTGVSPAWAVQSTIRVVVYGDSLTSGYLLQPEQAFPAKLYRKLRENGFTNVEVTNMSQPGETTAGGLARISSVLELHPDIVVLQLGYNDAIRGIRVETINSNLGSIMSQLTANQIIMVLVGVRAPASMSYEYAGQLENMYRSLANANKAYLYPDALDTIYGRQEMNLADGFHPNARGVETMVEYIYPLVDAVVRWKAQTLQAQQQYEEQMQMQMQERQSTEGR